MRLIKPSVGFVGGTLLTLTACGGVPPAHTLVGQSMQWVASVGYDDGWTVIEPPPAERSAGATLPTYEDGDRLTDWFVVSACSNTQGLVMVVVPKQSATADVMSDARRGRFDRYNFACAK